MQKHVNKKVLAVVSDLFFVAKISEAARRAGVTVDYVTEEKAALEHAKSLPMVIILDLNFDAVHPLRLIGKLKADAGTKSISVIGYLSHVQGELKQQAHESGCDMVMPRSAFSLNLPQILKRHAGTL
ncbi:MAG: response regulator [Acidobacteria bacterium]|nr:response regulator [Acidobacteriota bacterium]MBI3469848.1 response regulator [Candidatus Solibacter usitatus]